MTLLWQEVRLRIQNSSAVARLYVNWTQRKLAIVFTSNTRVVYIYENGAQYAKEIADSSSPGRAVSNTVKAAGLAYSSMSLSEFEKLLRQTLPKPWENKNLLDSVV